MTDELRQDLLREVRHAKEQLNTALQALDNLETLLSPLDRAPYPDRPSVLSPSVLAS